ncbi:MAG: hypothetical protein O4861_13505 [Trichodesmium sp. St16_bin4-tuft]|jgi:hypothetical protein|uniref:Uncharacterized protein n=1 Tax=Trichodesmium erythraeum (strain IMS101) TaxID=203124 RepID=Q10Y13_TRIEI|nr:hypothetical protein [Trichodesmium erythraeum GBRTRLIN201]MCL2929914.1 hypothetical protein [Trichodesmium sp. MAG_R01]MDE5068983.1 hypothetical protein [Trichodesmium sp. St4_bin8_1]MDE5070864.1 hypothetical protein [Trichodesmium sp. St5_bin8]MDE5099285.1 hypothetical protein [Trichodesmium sp. St16_bin4-tuft]MDE5104122.1 hypothetical protein [Trichodesmium sp. St19_bin2]
MVKSQETAVQEANTIILELSGDKDDYSELIKGKGKVFDKLRRTITKLKDQGEILEDAQPICVVVKKKR